eukprot:PhF_6_TR37512/c2_g2_i1/m.55444
MLMVWFVYNIIVILTTILGCSNNIVVYGAQDGLSYSPNSPKTLSGTIKLRGYNTWPGGYTPTTNQFCSGIYDGTNVWMIPNDADRVIKVEASSGTMTGYSSWPGGFTKSTNAFLSSVYDGTNVWMIPYQADRVIKVSTATGTMTGYNTWPGGLTGTSFVGGCYDGTYVWMVPYSASHVVKVAVAGGAMTGYNSWPGGFSMVASAFFGGAYDGTSMWMIPYNADRVIQVTVATGAMTGYNSWPSGVTTGSSSFQGGVYDGTNIWLVPYSSNRVVKLETGSGTMTDYSTWPSGFTKGTQSFSGGVYDGTYVWLVPRDASHVLKIHAVTGIMFGYQSWPSGFTKSTQSWCGVVHDGTTLWMVPYSADRVLNVYANPFTKSATSESTLTMTLSKSYSITARLSNTNSFTKEIQTRSGSWTDEETVTRSISQIEEVSKTPTVTVKERTATVTPSNEKTYATVSPSKMTPIDHITPSPSFTRKEKSIPSRTQATNLGTWDPPTPSRSLSDTLDVTATQTTSITESFTDTRSHTPSQTNEITLSLSFATISQTQIRTFTQSASLFVAFLIVRADKVVSGDDLANRFGTRPRMVLKLLGATWKTFDPVTIVSLLQVNVSCNSKGNKKGFDSSRATIAESTVTSLSDDKTTLIVDLGFDDGYTSECAETASLGDVSPLTTSNRVRSYENGQPYWSFEIGPTTSLGKDVQAYMSAFQSAALVGSCTVNIVGVSSLQSIILVSTSPCMSRTMRQSSNGMTTSNFIMCPMCFMVEHQSNVDDINDMGAILYNMAFQTILIVAHMSIMFLLKEFRDRGNWLDAMATTRFPSLSVALIFLFSQSTTMFAVRSLQTGKGGNTAAAVLGVSTIPLLYIAIRTLTKKYVTCTAVPVETRNMARSFLGPRCLWYPVDVYHAFGSLMDFIPQRRTFYGYILVHNFTVGVLTAVTPPSDVGCQIILGTLSASFFALGGLYWIFRPVRTPVHNSVRGMLLVSQGITPALRLYGTSAALNTVPLVVFAQLGMLMLETIFVIIGYGFEYYAITEHVAGLMYEANTHVLGSGKSDDQHELSDLSQELENQLLGMR